MGEKTVKDRTGKTLPPDTAEVGGAAYAPHDKETEKLTESAAEEQKSRDSAGDERTPEKTIGEIKYAKNADK